MENIDVNNKIELEFPLKTSSNILFNRLSTPSGLSEWFADDVDVDGDIFTFFWDDSESQAELVSKKENKQIRYRWLENGEANDDETYFEFSITADEVTRGIALHVIEVVSDPDDVEDTESLWNCQIAELIRVLGL
ncbi:MAG TPA: START-like domain-containing protein [Perlabentimonas sp.]|nr:START-like domain-containing protein [Bacteroidales bacterium]MDD4672364.1 START-like domain-containing protein [Bacteroidales bacterium]HZJ74363.1 START-like domain-containing protein [Perlabentimonas sp.]